MQNLYVVRDLVGRDDSTSSMKSSLFLGSSLPTVIRRHLEGSCSSGDCVNWDWVRAGVPVVDVYLVSHQRGGLPGILG